jgi:hypothetical protein
MKKHALLCNGRAVAVGLFLTILLALTARATDAPLLSDAHISSTHPSTDFGSLTNVAVGNGNTALIQFDLDRFLPEPLPETRRYLRLGDRTKSLSMIIKQQRKRSSCWLCGTLRGNLCKA